MEIATLTDFRNNMKAYFDKVLALRKPLFIARPHGKDMVLMSREEYESMEETFHLLKSPKNAARLLRAIEADKSGEGTLHNLVE
jgi:antitoxin YefM